MGSVALEGFGGGGGTDSALRVVGGTTRPKKPTPNMIWVNTDKEITKWALTGKNPYILDSDNLYVTATTPEVYIDVSGALVPISNYNVTPYIELPDSTISVTITTDGNVSSLSYQAFYDADKNLISTVARGIYTNVYSVPPNAKYIRISERDHESVTLIASYASGEENGVVWIALGDAGKNKIPSTVGDDWITIYPISAKQFVDGAWVNVEAMSYQNGEWAPWIVYLFKHGDLCEKTTGGWQTRAWKVGDHAIARKPTLTTNADSVTLSLSEAGTYISGVYECINDIDLTSYHKISITCSGSMSSANSTSGAYLGIVDRTGTYPGSIRPAFVEMLPVGTSSIPKRTFELPIDEIVGSWGIIICMKCDTTSSTPVILTVYEISLT